MAVEGGLAGACAGSSYLVVNTSVRQLVMKVLARNREETGRRGKECMCDLLEEGTKYISKISKAVKNALSMVAFQ